jgi:hypothetical protein
LNPDDVSGVTRVSEEVMCRYMEDKERRLKLRAKAAATEKGIEKHKRYQEKLERGRVLKLQIEEEARHRARALKLRIEEEALVKKEAEQIECLEAEWSVEFYSMKPHISTFVEQHLIIHGGTASMSRATLTGIIIEMCKGNIMLCENLDRKKQEVCKRTQSWGRFAPCYPVTLKTWDRVWNYALSCHAKGSLLIEEKTIEKKTKSVQKKTESLQKRHTVPVVIKRVLEKYGKCDITIGVLRGMAERHIETHGQPSDSFDQLHLKTTRLFQAFRVPLRVPRLKTWLASIGLSTVGKKMDLLLRLREFYGIAAIC